jgi:hypothetical protein
LISEILFASLKIFEEPPIIQSVNARQSRY